MTPHQYAYAALWRIIEPSPELHAARKVLLEMIGGKGSPAQREAIEWVVSEFGGPSDAEMMRQGL